MTEQTPFDELLSLISLTDPASGYIPIHVPFSGDRLVYLPVCDADDVVAAVSSARQAQKTWARQPLPKRVQTLVRFAHLAWNRRDVLFDLMQLECGKTRRDGLEEIADVVLTILHYARKAPGILAPKHLRGSIPFLSPTRVERPPIGVVGVISPWNYPLTLAISDAVPALLAGNTVLLKPSERTSLTALYVRLLLIEAGLPPEVFQVVTGGGEELGPPLIENIDFLQFTGSSAVGRSVAVQAADRLIGSSLELGGKNPLIVLDDAPISRTVSGIIQGCFANAGQLCISFERLYVQRGIYDRLVPALVRRMESMRIGRGLDFDVDMGSLISREHLVKVDGHVQEAIANGARVLTGGRPLVEIGPLFYAPTLLEGVTAASRIYAEETFGPVVSLFVFDEDDEALRMANDSRFGLNASVWSSDVDRAGSIARRLETGAASINDAYSAGWSSYDAPREGWKMSGIGSRHGDEGMLKFTRSRAVTVQRIHPVAPSEMISGRVLSEAIQRVVSAKLGTRP